MDERTPMSTRRMDGGTTGKARGRWRTTRKTSSFVFSRGVRHNNDTTTHLGTFSFRGRVNAQSLPVCIQKVHSGNLPLATGSPTEYVDRLCALQQCKQGKARLKRAAAEVSRGHTLQTMGMFARGGEGGLGGREPNRRSCEPRWHHLG